MNTETPIVESGTTRPERKKQNKIKYWLAVSWTTVVISSISAPLIILIFPSLRNTVWDNIKQTNSYKQSYSYFSSFFPKEEKVVLPPPRNPEIDIITSYVKRRNSRLPIEIAKFIAEEVVRAAKKNNLAIPLILGIMETESTFNPLAQNNIPNKPGDLARGLMQIYQGEYVTIDKSKAFDIVYNIDMGCAILNGKLEIAKGSLEKALFYYSGEKADYPKDIMQAVGRYALYKWEIENPKTNDILINEDVEISMVTE